MDRNQKTDFVANVKGSFGGTAMVILTDFKGSTPFELDKVRRNVEKAGAKFKIVKNTLARLAVNDSDFAPLATHFKGNIGVVFAGEDASAAVKAFLDLRKENDKLQIRAGFFDGAVIDAKAVEAVATMPGKNELRAMLLATLMEGPRRMAAVLSAPARDMTNVVQNQANKLEGEEG